MANEYRAQRKVCVGSSQRELCGDNKGFESSAFLVDNIHLHDIRFQGRHAFASAESLVRAVFLYVFGLADKGGTRQGVKIQERAVFWITIAAILAWIASVLAHLLGCVPVQRVWQIVPYPGGKSHGSSIVAPGEQRLTIKATCTTRPQNYIVTGSLNML